MTKTRPVPIHPQPALLLAAIRPALGSSSTDQVPARIAPLAQAMVQSRQDGIVKGSVMDWASIAEQKLFPLGIIVAWLVLMRFVLPRLGIPT